MLFDTILDPYSGGLSDVVGEVLYTIIRTLFYVFDWKPLAALGDWSQWLNSKLILTGRPIRLLKYGQAQQDLLGENTLV